MKVLTCIASIRDSVKLAVKLFVVDKLGMFCFGGFGSKVTFFVDLEVKKTWVLLKFLILKHFWGLNEINLLWMRKFVTGRICVLCLSAETAQQICMWYGARALDYHIHTFVISFIRLGLHIIAKKITVPLVRCSFYHNLQLPSTWRLRILSKLNRIRLIKHSTKAQ